MSIDQAEIEKLAELARIRIAADELPAITSGIASVLAMVDQMQSVATDGVEPMSNPLNACQRLREDRVTEADQRDEFQALAPATEDGLYLVPKVID